MSRTIALLLIITLFAPARLLAEDIFIIEVVYFAQDEASALSDFRHGQRLPDTEVPDFSGLDMLSHPLPEAPPAEDGEADADTINEAFMRGLFDEQTVTDEPTRVPLEVLLTEGEGGLDALVAQLRRHSATTVLDHQRWYQSASRFERPRFLQIHDGHDHRPARESDRLQSTEPGFWDESLLAASQAPEHQPTYRLEGRVAFTRGTYFHLWLDLVYRQPVPSDLPWAQRTAAGIESVEFLHHRLDERRRLSLDEWQYFDSPHLGAVAVVRRYRPEPSN